jgi:hypothetical protein
MVQNNIIITNDKDKINKFYELVNLFNEKFFHWSDYLNQINNYTPEKCVYSFKCTKLLEEIITLKSDYSQNYHLLIFSLGNFLGVKNFNDIEIKNFINCTACKDLEFKYISIIIQIGCPEILFEIEKKFKLKFGTSLEIEEVGKYETPLYKISGNISYYLLFLFGIETGYFEYQFENTGIWPFHDSL